MVQKTSVSRVIFNIFNYTFMVLVAFVCLVPLWHVIMASFSNPRALVASTGVLFTPAGEATLDGYKLVLNNPKILTGYMNTLIYVGSTTVLGAVLTLIAGYVLSRKNMKAKGILTMFVVITMMFGGGLIPTYMVIRGLGMVNTRWALIIPGVINAFYIIMMKNAFEQLPVSYEEAALIDGATPMTVLIEILVPMVKATIAVVVMFNIVQQWNSWYPASIYLTGRRDLWPLQLIMREVLVQNDSAKVLSGAEAAQKADLTHNLVKYCTTVVGTLPVLLAYPFAQKYFVTGVTLGGVKG